MQALIAPQARITRLACFGTQLWGALWKALLAAPDACSDANSLPLGWREQGLMKGVDTEKPDIFPTRSAGTKHMKGVVMKKPDIFATRSC